MVTNSKKHLPFVDGLRGIAALYVLLHHAVLQYYSSVDLKSFNSLQKISLKIFMLGHLAVNLFIVLSGFSLMLPVLHTNYKLKNGVLNFFKRRAIRILPPYYLAVLFSTLLIFFFIGNKSGLYWDISLPISTKALITHVLLIHDFFQVRYLKLIMYFGLFPLNQEFIFCFLFFCYYGENLNQLIQFSLHLLP